MTKKNLGLILFSALLSFSFVVPSTNNVIPVRAEDVQTLDLVQSIQSIYANDLADVTTNELFDYGIRHGALNIGDRTTIIPGCYKFDSKGPNEKYIYTNDNKFPGYFDWQGGRYHFSGYDGLIFKIVAKENIKITTRMTSTVVKGWVDNCQLTYFKSTNYNEDSGTWIGNDAVINKIELYPTGGSYATQDDIYYQIKLNKGETFYWEYSWNWYDTRNIEIGNSGFKFDIEEGFTPKVVTSETYQYLTMIENVASINCNDVSPNLGALTTLTTYGFRHGSVEEGNISKFSEHSPTWLGHRTLDPTSGTFMENWRFTSVDGDGAIIYFKAEKDIRLNIERPTFGNDLREGLTLNIYKNGTKVHSKTFDGVNDNPNDFSYYIELEQDDYIYWEAIHYGSGCSVISMGDNGSDMSTLPTFTAIESTNIASEHITTSSFISNLYNAGENKYTLDNQIASYSVYKGSYENNNLVDVKINETSLEKDGVKLTASKLTVNNDTLTIKVEAITDLAFSLDIIPDNFVNSNFNVKFIRYFARSRKAKMYLNINFDNVNRIGQIDDYLICEADDNLYIEFTSLSGEIEFASLSKFNFLEKCIGDGVKSSYPCYDPTDYSTKTSFTHKEVAFESARIKCEPIQTNKFSIQLLTGKVSEDGESLLPFNNVLYEDGQYIGSTTSPSMRLTGKGDSFDGENYAAVEDYRLKTSSVAGVAYKITAKIDTAFVVTHPATNGGWVGQGAETYISYYQSNGSSIKNISKSPVITANNAANVFAYTFNLKAGDTGYLVYEEEVANQRNLNIAFNFALDEASYDEAAREEIFGKVSVTARMEDVITMMMNNDCNPIIFEETLEVNLVHGNVKEPTKFIRSECEGKGRGDADDALVNGPDGATLAKFFRWQIRAGLKNDDAIMIFKAHKDMHLVIKHPANKDSWSTASSFKYYYADTDGFLDFKKEKFVASDLGDDFFGYDCHLKQGQSLVIAYSSNDESNFGVVDVCWVAHATTEDYDPTKLNDFSEARRIQLVKDQYQTQLNEQVAALNKSDYSTSNWGKIETYLKNYGKNVETLNDEAEITKEYNTAKNNIAAVKTKAQEAEELAAYKESAITEASNYVEASKDGYKKETLAQAYQLLDEFKETVPYLETMTEVRLELLSFKAAIDALPHDGLTKAALYGIIGGGVALLVAAGVTTFLVIRKKKKK